MAVVYKMPDRLTEFTGLVDAAAAETWISDNGTWLASVIDQHKQWLKAENVHQYQAAYDGYLEEIDQREASRSDNINKKLQASYAQLAVDTVVDFMLGNAMVWTVEDPEGAADKAVVDKAVVEEYRKKAIPIFKGPDFQRVLREQLTQGSVACYSAVITWVDENGKIDYEEFPVQEIIPIYDTRGRLRMIIRYYQVDISEPGEESNERTKVEVYDPRYISYYLADETGTNYNLDEEEAKTGNPIEHKAGRIPVGLFVNGVAARYDKRQTKNGVSDLEIVFNLIEEYSHVMSDKGNTVQRLLDQYLVLTGVDTDEKEVQKMHKARAISLKSKESKAEFIAPKQDDQAVENHLNRARETIHDLTFTPQLNNLVGATATEIKLKYAPLDIKAGKKETYFTSSIRQLVAVITDMLNAERLIEAGVAEEELYEYLTGDQERKGVTLYNPDWVAFTLNRNLPQNYKEIAEMVSMLAGIAPDSYLYELLWFIDDPVAALNEMKKQKEQAQKEAAAAAQAAIGYGGEFGNTGANNGEGGND
ncbi:portal protein [Bacillus phage vB_BboS-125]|uniref:Portal protein n=1 Tax=Bacillus phage vB_BboS-125 TaxID=2419618 RepID=A0A3G3BWF1_9CAUD|nr:portal protein [Bacillus phage vB_BboS-125]AYP68436.1 portal protein [Bacillus phage vB_BboS-125]